MNDVQKVNILGTEYTIKRRHVKDDKYLNLKDRAGYCDTTSKTIVVSLQDETNELDNYEVFLNKLLRHEIIHAFLFESGLAENWNHVEYGHDETYVDWIASQFPKMVTVMKEVGVL